MPPMAKKRRASDTESTEEGQPMVTQKVVKKVKSSASAAKADGKDDEGNPFWEVIVPNFLIFHTELTWFLNSCLANGA